MPAPHLSLTITATVGAGHVAFLRRHLRAAHRMLGARMGTPLQELSLALVNDARMSKLHRQFMGVSAPTDVLTFPLDLDGRGRPVAGEVVVCVPEARRRAKEWGIRLEHELLLYALHGLLHLCGHDDRTAASFRAMHRTEDQILTRLGVGPVFAPARHGSARHEPAGRNGARGPSKPRVVRRAARRGRQAAGGGAR